MLRKIILVIFLCLTFAGVVFAQNLKVNGQPAEEGGNLNLFFDDLDAGKINFSLEAANIKKAEITFDKGRSWLEMEQDGDNFVYGYRPLTNEVFFPEMLLTDENQSVQTYRPNLRINYHKEKPDQQLEQFLEKFKSFYEDENKERFLSLFSSRYPDRVKFEEAIQNDFYNYRNMRLFYRIDTRAFEDDLEGAIWNVYWQRKYQDRNGNDQAESSANIAMRFDKEGGNWMITGLRNNTVFGSSLLSSPDLTVSSLSYTEATSTVNAVIQNIGDASASGVTAQFYKDGVADGAAVNVSPTSIGALSTGTVSHTYAGVMGVPHLYKVTVDAANVVNESDETNNSREENHTFPI